MSWPAEIDVFLAIGELALYVAYLDGWPARQRIWPWATALTGLSVSVAGNIGHIEAHPGQPVILTDRLTAATSPIAAFAGLALGLLVLKMTRQQAIGDTRKTTSVTNPAGPLEPAGCTPLPARPALAVIGADPAQQLDDGGGSLTDRLLQDASLIYKAASSTGERLSQRSLARHLRTQGHRFSNEHLHGIAASIGLSEAKAA